MSLPLRQSSELCQAGHDGFGQKDIVLNPQHRYCVALTGSSEMVAISW
jgi:hypothetical protein